MALRDVVTKIFYTRLRGAVRFFSHACLFGRMASAHVLQVPTPFCRRDTFYWLLHFSRTTTLRSVLTRPASCKPYRLRHACAHANNHSGERGWMTW